MSVINTNITSMIGQQNLNASKSALTTSMERLSSGLRINSAKDDAAGQAIANRMSSQITGLAQAQRNANDGISVAQTAEGALNQVNDNVQRIRELTVQAQNGTNSPDDLQSIQDEINQRTSEIDRISKETNFNGVKVLSEEQSISIQVGANDNEVIEVGLKQITTATLGLDKLDVTNLAKTASASAFSGSGSPAVVGTSFASATPDTVLQNGSTTYVQKDDGKYYQVTSTTVSSAGVVSLTVGSSALSEDAVSSAGLAPLADIDSALEDVDSLRSDLGAVQNRFDSAITNLSTTETNLSAARSRIEDADYAVEVANMTRAQILQQAGTSVLAQANQVPQSVLSLLG